MSLIPQVYLGIFRFFLFDLQEKGSLSSTILIQNYHKLS